ncbi:MAG TPA: DUF420 domain-containing protein [Planctomycetaceae bacterium]|nr:DUF420 domain-containing protein [Planctomycetaceae bacterium]
MSNGFLGYNASLMLDVVVCALVLVVPTLAYSIWVVKIRRNYVRHRNVQVALGAVLLVTVAAFEIDLQVVHGGWEQVVNKPGHEPRLSDERLAVVRQVLHVHLVFAISTPVLWAVTLLLAWRRFPRPPSPSAHSRLHKRLGWLSTADIALTSVTGLVFYYMAFVAP